MPRQFSAVVDFPLTTQSKGFKVKLGNVKVKQLPVNCNIATTGHKLQVMSKDSLMVNSWGYTIEN